MMRRSLYTKFYYRYKHILSTSNYIASSHCFSSYGLNTTRLFTSTTSRLLHQSRYEIFDPFCRGENHHLYPHLYDEVKEAKGECDSGLPVLAVNCTREDTAVEEEVTSIKKGNRVNLSDLIFTENRDYLIKCSDGQQVRAEELAGKIVVIYFDSVLKMNQMHMTYLMDIYNDLQPNNGFEVIFVDVNDFDASFGGEISLNLSHQGETQIIFEDVFHCMPWTGEISLTPSHQGEPQKNFEDVFRCMPWTAIPLSDITSRKHLKQRFGVPEPAVVKSKYSFVIYPTALVIDPTGTVLQCDGCAIFQYFGALGYPFSDERLNYLKFEDNETAKHPSLEALLASPQRDYLITNKGDKVPIHTLEDKVVALYFYEEGFTDENITLELKMAYKELAKNNEKFEVVLIYLYDGGNASNFTNEDSFWKTFKAMPWLAVPFRDSIHKKLQRIFVEPWVFEEPWYALIIIGPRMEFIEPFGSFILREYKIPAFPFTREKVAKLMSEEANEINLEMLWDPESNIGERYGFQVQYSQLAGKRVIIFFECLNLQEYEVKFLETLEERYNQLKGTADEFEVIRITPEPRGNEIKARQVGNLPWFVQPAGAFRGYADRLFNFYERHNVLHRCSLIAFGQDGRVVRRTIYPTIADSDFPFYAGDLEKEALLQLVGAYRMDCLHFNIYLYNIQIDPVFKPCVPGPLVPCFKTYGEMRT